MAKKTKKPAPAQKKKPVIKPTKPARKPAKLAPKKSPKKPVKHSKPVIKKTKPKAKPVAKAKPAPAAKPSRKAVAPAKAAKSTGKQAAPSINVPKAAATAKSSARADLRSKILEKSKTKEKLRPLSFSFDEIREIAKTAARIDTDAKTAAAKSAAKSGKHLSTAKLEKAAQPHHIKAASLADILGFNPKKAKHSSVENDEAIPEKFRRFYRLLIDLRNHLTGQIDTHSEETLKRSAKDDAGDLSSYGQHMADAGTDTFDRDFALSMVASEQEALSEVEAAVQRIKAGTYGLCEVTQKPIAKERLLAVPFTRYSAEAQKSIEKNRHRSRTQAGLFGELGEEGGTISSGSGGDDGGDE